MELRFPEAHNGPDCHLIEALFEGGRYSDNDKRVQLAMPQSPSVLGDQSDQVDKARRDFRQDYAPCRNADRPHGWTKTKW
jgi:hypothetical protein